MNCDVCGEPFSIETGNFDYTALAGLDPERHQITVKGIELLRCRCGVAPRVPNIDGLHFTIGLALIRDEAPLDGSAVRFLRKTIGMTQVEFARAIDIAPEYLSDWERGKLTPKKPTRVSAAVQFLEHILNTEEARRTISMDFLIDTLGRMMARTKPDDARREADLEVDAASCPPAWMISEIRDRNGNHVGGGT